MKIRIILIATGLWSIASISFAGSVAGFGGGTEITQILNNVELVGIDIQSEMQSVEQIKQTYFHTLQQANSLVNGYTQPMQQARGVLDQATNVQRNLYALNGNLDNLDNQLAQRRTEFGASSSSWDDYVVRERQLIDSGDQAATAKLAANRQALQDTAGSIDAYEQANADMEATTGTHAATQQLGYMLTILGGDITRLLAITAQNQITSGMNENDASIKRRKSLEATNQRETMRQGNWDDSQKFLNILRNGRQ